jgi:pimeloyl-ACP methyl ester carboxylesterase
VILAAWLGCATLDGFVFNPVHCSTVGPATCGDLDEEWDQICARCADAYDWGKEYPWFPETLIDGSPVRAIPPEIVEAVPFPSEDGAATLDAYFVPSHRENPETADVTVLYNHGNYAGIEHYLPRLRYLHEAGYNLFVWDYRGYGKSKPDTTPTGDQLLADADTAFAVGRSLAPDPDRLVSYGYSLGAVAATRMAEQQRPCALVLEAPFTSIGSITTDNTTLSLGDGMLSSGAFDNADRMSRIEAPTLAMIGTDDHLFSPEEVRAMVEQGPGPRTVEVLPGVEHGVANVGIPEAGLEAYLGLVGGFLAESGCLGP